MRIWSSKWSEFFAALIFALCLAALPASAQTSSQWEWSGWGGGGFFWSSAAHATDPDCLYLGGDVGGVYRSDDRGLSWHFINNGLNHYAIYSMAAAVNDPDTLYVMTENGVSRSLDRGDHWTPLKATLKGGLDLSSKRRDSVRALAVDPRDSKTVYAGGHKGYLYKTTDGGESWNELDYFSAITASGPASSATAKPKADASSATFRGKGCLAIQMNSPAGSWKENGRAKGIIYPDVSNWSAYNKLTARILAPKKAGRVDVQLVVQSGDNWAWQAGPYVTLKKGEWSEVAFNLGAIKSLDNVKAMYVMVRIPENAYKGDVYVDAVELHGAQTKEIFGWDKGGKDHWQAEPRKGFTLASSVQVSAGYDPKPAVKPAAVAVVATTEPAVAAVSTFRGTGCLGIQMNSPAGSWKENGRAKGTIYPDVSNWSAYNKLTARVFAPKKAGRVDIQLVVQSGDNWAWQAGPYVTLKKGEWSEVAFNLGAIKSLDNVKAMYVMARIPENAYKGMVYVDAVELHGAQTKELFGWDKGGTDHWKTETQFKGFSLATSVQHVAGTPAQAATAVVSVPKPKVNAVRSIISSVAISPLDSNLIFVTSRMNGVFVSKDAGKTWAHSTVGEKTMCITPSPVDKNEVFLAAGTQHVMRSADGGLTWKSISSGLDAEYFAREVAVSPFAPYQLVCIGKKGWNGTIYRSENGGASWTSETRLAPESAADTSGKTVALSRPSNVTISPLVPGLTFVAANWHNALSSDAGKNWRICDKGADITVVTDIRFQDGKVYASAMDEGVFTSADDGANWTHLWPNEGQSGWNGHSWRIAVSGNNIVTTSSPWDDKIPNGIVYSKDGGNSFVRTMSGLPTVRTRKNTTWGSSYPRALAADPSNPNVLYVGLDGDADPAKKAEAGGIFKSTDGGASWNRLPAQPAGTCMFYGLAVDPTDSNRLFWGACKKGGGMYRSEDGGATWSLVSRAEGFIYNVMVTPSGTVYYSGKNLWRSVDHGDTWEQVTHFSDWSVVGLEVDPQNEQRLWISQVTWYGRAEGSILETMDGGKTWNDITGDNPYCKPLILRFNPKTRELWSGGTGMSRMKVDG